MGCSCKKIPSVDPNSSIALIESSHSNLDFNVL